VSINITVSSNAAEVSRVLRALYADQLPFAAMKALNRTGNAVQDAQRKGQRQRFEVRRTQWADRSVKRGRGDFATKQRLQAIVRIEAYGDPSRSDVLTQHEKAGTKRPKSGKRLAIPVEARPGRSKAAYHKEKPKAFGFTPHGKSRRVYTGDRRTFMVLNPDGSGGIYQRTGRKVRGRRRLATQGRRMASSLTTRRVQDQNVRTLYTFTPRGKLDARLGFEETARRVIEQEWPKAMREEFARAVRSAR